MKLKSKTVIIVIFEIWKYMENLKISHIGTYSSLTVYIKHELGDQIQVQHKSWVVLKISIREFFFGTLILTNGLSTAGEYGH